ncbi:hypothetical protein SAMN04487857_102354 [Pseudomonas sp. ok272]|nr:MULTISPECIES: hypothetical protein [unclassified Pseudomonas]SEM50810.1 hypothetical protein SAMN04487857_102354 [Pseudomonas sp. ok272]SFM22413.1 hypothetical protein SAMN04487858_101355 [Pseudomonas sp. ok602]
MDNLQDAIQKLCEAGMIEEANVLLGALKNLKQSLNRLKVCNDGKIVMVH